MIAGLGWPLRVTLENAEADSIGFDDRGAACTAVGRAKNMVTADPGLSAEVAGC